MIGYDVEEVDLELVERKNGDDFEFVLSPRNELAEKKLQQVRDFFEGNEIHSDVMFISQMNEDTQVIVRPDCYHDFILQLFREQLIRRVFWC